MAKIAAVAFTLGLAMLGIGLPDLLPDDAKVWVVIAALVFLAVGIGLWTTSRWTIVRRDQLRLPSPATRLPTPVPDQAQLPTRVPLIEALEQHASRLSDMLDARFAESPGPKGRLPELLTTQRQAFDASVPAREEHDRRTLAIYFEQFRTPGLPLFDEAVDVWWAGNPKARRLIEKPESVDDLRNVENVFRRLAHNLREKETDKAMEARGFVQAYVPVDPKD